MGKYPIEQDPDEDDIFLFTLKVILTFVVLTFFLSILYVVS